MSGSGTKDDRRRLTTPPGTSSLAEVEHNPRNNRMRAL
jgi:hypothetical protein